MPKRITLEVYVNLDDVPGLFHDEDSAQDVVQNILSQRIPYYKPVVLVKEK